MKEYLESYAKEINSKFRRLNHLVSHASAIGGYHEFIIRAFLRKFLSKRYGIKTGFIHDPSSKTTSKQIDILIVDEDTSVPYYFIEDDLVVVDPKNVRCTIEIKTSLNQDNFKGAIDNHVSIMKTGSKCVSLVFAYSSNADVLSTIGSWMKAHTKELHKFKNYPPAIFIMDRGIVQFISETVANPWGYYIMEPLPNNQSAELMVTSHFLAVVVKAIDKYSGKESDPFSIYSSEAVFMNQWCFRFGHEPVRGVLLSPHATLVKISRSGPIQSSDN